MVDELGINLSLREWQSSLVIASFNVRMAGKCFRKNTTIRKHEQIFYRCAELICQNIDQANVKPNNSAII